MAKGKGATSSKAGAKKSSARVVTITQASLATHSKAGAISLASPKVAVVVGGKKSNRPARTAARTNQRSLQSAAQGATGPVGGQGAADGANVGSESGEEDMEDEPTPFTDTMPPAAEEDGLSPVEQEVFDISDEGHDKREIHQVLLDSLASEIHRVNWEQARTRQKLSLFGATLTDVQKAQQSSLEHKAEGLSSTLRELAQRYTELRTELRLASPDSKNSAATAPREVTVPSVGVAAKVKATDMPLFNMRLNGMVNLALVWDWCEATEIAWAVNGWDQALHAHLRHRAMMTALAPEKTVQRLYNAWADQQPLGGAQGGHRRLETDVVRDIVYEQFGRRATASQAFETLVMLPKDTVDSFAQRVGYIGGKCNKPDEDLVRIFCAGIKGDYATFVELLPSSQPVAACHGGGYG